MRVCHGQEAVTQSGVCAVLQQTNHEDTGHRGLQDQDWRQSDCRPASPLPASQETLGLVTPLRTPSNMAAPGRRRPAQALSASQVETS